MQANLAAAEIWNLCASLGVLAGLLGQIVYVAWRFGRIEQRLEDLSASHVQMWTLLRKHLRL